MIVIEVGSLLLGRLYSQYNDFLPVYVAQKPPEAVSEVENLKIFLGEHAPDPPSLGMLSHATNSILAPLHTFWICPCTRVAFPYTMLILQGN